jgi:hypothetical protein
MTSWIELNPIIPETAGGNSTMATMAVGLVRPARGRWFGLFIGFSGF